MTSHLQSNKGGVPSGGTPPPTMTTSSSSNEPDYESYLRESKRRSLKLSAAREIVRGRGRSRALSGRRGDSGRGDVIGRGSGGFSIPPATLKIGDGGTGAGSFSVPPMTPGIQGSGGLAQEGETIVPTSYEKSTYESSSAHGTVGDNREVIHIDHAQRDKRFGPNSENVARFICGLLKQFIALGALQWKDIPIDVKNTMFNRFLMKYRFHSPSDEAFARHAWEHVAKNRMKNILSNARVQAKKAAGGADDATLWKEHRPLWMLTEVWSSLCDKWNTEEWKKRSQAGRHNRAKVPEANVHTSGSVSFATQKRRMEVDLGREAKHWEVFDRTHKKKGTDEYVSTRSQEVAEAYVRQMTEKYGEDMDQQPTIDHDAWIAAAGPPKKGRVYGFGESLDSTQVLPAFHGSYRVPSSGLFDTTATGDYES